MSKKVMTGFMGLWLCASGASAGETPAWTTPAVEGYGKIVYDPALAVQPDKALEYKVIFQATSDAEREGVNGQLWHVARLVNLLAAGGVPRAKMHIVAGVAGKATDIVLSDKAYEQRHHKPNPNTALIRALARAGVVLYVCSQAMAEHGISAQELNPDIMPSLSLVTDLTNYQLQGYVLIP